jgi:hypothetical protein
LTSDRQEYLHAARLRDRLEFCRRFWKRQHFYHRFLRERLIIEDNSHRFFAFDHGRFVGSWPSRRQAEQAQAGQKESDEEESILICPASSELEKR